MKRIFQNLKFLTDDEVLEIHNTSLKILEEIGCYIPHVKILQILDGLGGVKIDFNKKLQKVSR